MRVCHKHYYRGDLGCVQSLKFFFLRVFYRMGRIVVATLLSSITSTWAYRRIDSKVDHIRAGCRSRGHLLGKNVLSDGGVRGNKQTKFKTKTRKQTNSAKDEQARK